jgi:hypothetical protein
LLFITFFIGGHGHLIRRKMILYKIINRCDQIRLVLIDVKKSVNGPFLEKDFMKIKRELNLPNFESDFQE